MRNIFVGRTNAQPRKNTMICRQRSHFEVIEINQLKKNFLDINRPITTHVFINTRSKVHTVCETEF